MNKDSIIGLVLIAAIIFGFGWYQSKQYEKQLQAQAQIDSVARMEAMQRIALDSLAAIQAGNNATQPVVSGTEQRTNIYKDDSLGIAAVGEASLVYLRNDKVEVVLTTKGAQPYSVNVLGYKAYGGDSLMLVKPQWSDYGISVYTGEYINTRDFNFQLVEASDSVAVMRLVFADGGYIQQKYTLPADSYMVYNELSFNGMQNNIPRNVSMFDIDWTLKIPRLEKGFKNEKQYSKIEVYCPGDKKPEVVGKGGRDGSKRYDSRLEWIDFNQQFFSAILTAPTGFANGEVGLAFAQENDDNKALMTCSAKLREDITLQNGSAKYDFEFYFGPNDYYELRSYDRKYEKTITIGGNIIGLITRFVIIPCFKWLSARIANFGIIILIMTVLIKVVISPLTMKSYMSSAKMNAIKPEIDKLNEKFPKASSDQKEAMKKQQAQMELYKRAGINPAGGCLPMLLTIPILWAMFRFFPVSIELRQQPFLWAEDLSAYDSICNFGFRFLGMDHLSLFALLMAVTMWLYSWMTMPKSSDPQMAPMRFMSVWIMPIMMFFICNSLSSGLSYYYLLSNLIMMVQNFIIKKWIIKPEKILAQIEASKGKPLPKSKWQQRLEAAQKMAEQQQKANNRRH